MKQRIIKLLPWVITAAALVIAFRGLDWAVFFSHLKDVEPLYLIFAALLTCSSYVLRTRRWQALFPNPVISYVNAFRVLILGFFMNNVLPARTGELVRAHLGSKVTGEKRTLVLATIASERLVDGLVISFMFVVFAFGMGDSEMSRNMLYVAFLFGIAGVSVILVLMFRQVVFRVARRITARFEHRATLYGLDRLQVFVNGLAPMWGRRRFIPVLLWSLIVWSVELSVFYLVSKAYGGELSLAGSVLFLVAVNFASLIPSAPGAIGVIEAVGSSALMSIGIPRELALTMVISQHTIQYVVVGVPGALLMLRWRDSLKQIELERQAEESEGAVSGARHD